MVRNPSNGSVRRQTRGINRTNNITGQKNIAENSARRNINQPSIYKKDEKRQQVKRINNNYVQNQRVNHTGTYAAPAYRNINAGAAGVSQNIRNIGINKEVNFNNYSGASYNSNARNVNNANAAPVRTGTAGRNGASSHRPVASIYSRSYVINEERINIGGYAGDKIKNKSERRRFLTGEDITTKIRRVTQRVNDGRLYAADVLKQLFLFKSTDQSKVVTKEKIKKAIPFQIIFSIILCVVFIMTWIFSGMKLHENAIVIADNETEIVKLQKKIKNNEILLEDKNDLSYIENVAVNELGMIKKELLPTQYITLDRNDEVELTNARNTDYVKITLDTIKDIFGSLK